MKSYLDPIDAAKQPREDFIRYLLTAYPLRDSSLRDKFEKELNKQGSIWQVPYLEGAQPYRPDLTVTDLVSKGVLHPEIAGLFLADRPLYQHQAAAVRAVVEKQENIIVATGTGSGKTECFLLPMIDQLLKEEAELQAAGVRVLILYPMNALVNDQVKRLRQLLCRQSSNRPRIQFGFYTSRTVKEAKVAQQALADELRAYSDEELLSLIPQAEQVELKALLSGSRREVVVARACEIVQEIQVLSRAEMQAAPPHILVTNYSMLEHMLIRPVERETIFERSAGLFKMLVVDEAHSYDGSTGTEVSMLIKRLKTAVNIESSGKMGCIATSASLGDRSVDSSVIQFAEELFGETFSQVVRGDRVSATERLGEPYPLPKGLAEDEVYEHFYALDLPELNDPLDKWATQLSYLVSPQQLQMAQSKAAEAPVREQIHRFLWYALKQHPTIHNLIRLLAQSPQPWEQIAQSSELWALPKTVEGEIPLEEVTKLQPALAHLIQLGTLAREHPEDLPLLPVRLHLLFRSVEGLYACVNPQCCGREHSSNHRYGRLYLSERKTCEDCDAPVVELASCRKCGQAYSLVYLGSQGELLSLPRSLEAVEDNKRIYMLTSGALDSITLDEEEEEPNTNGTETGLCLLTQREGWIGRVARNPDQFEMTATERQFTLTWHVPPNTKNTEGGYLSRCPACSARRTQTSSISRFISYTDAPLEVMIDSLFELLPEPAREEKQPTKRKLLAFSDGRQDAAFFSSDFQRTHTEALYRQLVWHAFQSRKDNEGIASVKQMEDALVEQFLEVSIPHPDRESEWHHRSYVPNDDLDDEPKNLKDCKDRARSRAKELLLREFGLPSARRFSIESLGLLACHLDWQNSPSVQKLCNRFSVSEAEAIVFLTALTDLIRLSGIVNVEKPSDYFPEVGGVEGGRPGILDRSGKVKKFLKLQKGQGDSKDAVSFCAYTGGNNQLIQSAFANYCEKVFENVQEQSEALKDIQLWIYEEVLLGSNVLAKYEKEGRQLSWSLLNVQETSEDWCRCNKCQQIFHLPGFTLIHKQPQSNIQKSPAFNVHKCSGFKCSGTLQPFTSEQMRDDHYRRLIRERQVLPLRAQEHTAQLETDDLAHRESRFRRGKINLLSCSTTLEMGVDIGELQAVVLRNFPPHVSNYQQRAGRAGRRTDGVAVTLMYGQRRPHDRYYFEQPERLIAGKNQIPKLDPRNFQVQERHIRAELLASFLRQDNLGAEEVTIANFLALPKDAPASIPNFTPPSHSPIVQFQRWLQGDSARQLTNYWLDKLGGEGRSHIQVLQEFSDRIEEFQKQQLRDWDALVEVLLNLQQRLTDPAEAKNLTIIAKRLAGTQAELNKIADRRLHDELARASILPIYGFPIDVVRLMTSQRQHRLERDRRLALGEYAPGQEIVVDDRVHTSVGMVRPEKLLQQYYWVCQNCNYFTSDLQEKIYDVCPICGEPPQLPSEKKTRLYKVPSAFTTEWRELPKVTPYAKPLRQPTSQVFLAKEGARPELLSHSNQPFHLIYSQGGRFFLSNQGTLKGERGFKSQGFAICKACGRNLTEQVREQQNQHRKSKGKQKTTSSNSTGIPHTHPMTDRPCTGWYEWMHLGHEFLSDLLKIRFNQETNPPALFAVMHFADGEEIASVDVGDSPMQQTGLGFWRSLTSALLAAASQVIDVPRTELDGLFRPSEERDGTAELVIYDNVPGGAGYSRKIGERFREVLQQAYRIVESCSCGTSCYDCLRTYSNQVFHDELNRHSVRRFLQPLVEQINPDPELQKFAPDSHRVTHAQIMSQLGAYCRTASSASIICLPQLEEPFTLKRLTEIINALQSRDEFLELILGKLPQPITDPERVLRKRLQQWIDQNALKLYVMGQNKNAELCLSSQWERYRVALQFQPFENNSPACWLRTTTERGVIEVYERLQQLKQRARPVAIQELVDKDTLVIFPDPTGRQLSLDELRHKIGLEQALVGSKITRIFYSDRYLQESGIRVLASLLKGKWLQPNTEIKIQTQQSSEEERSGDTRRRGTLEKVITQQLGIQTKVEMRPFKRRHEPPFPHKRELTIYRQDKQVYRVLFDKGLDFVDRAANGYYSITESTYIVVARQEWG
jgi:ATP-dependent helicase YprA (DUF1998 family)